MSIHQRLRRYGPAEPATTRHQRYRRNTRHRTGLLGCLIRYGATTNLLRHDGITVDVASTFAKSRDLSPLLLNVRLCASRRAILT